MNRKRVSAVLLMGAIVVTSINGNLVKSNAYEINSSNTLVDDYYNLLDEETKEMMDKEDVKVEETVKGKTKTIKIKNKDNEIISETTITELTEEEVIRKTMKSEGITYKEASKIIKDEVRKVQEKYSLSRTQAERLTSWHYKSNVKTHSFGVTSPKTELYGDYLLYRSGSFGSIEQIRNVGMKPASSGSFTLSNVNVRHMVTSFPTTSGPLRGDANLLIKTNYSAAMELQKKGFTVTGGVDGVYHCRKSIMHAYTYSI